MMQFEKKLLNKLLDSYENSSLSRGENKITIHISFPFQRKTVPQYFDESSGEYENIHVQLKQLEQRGFIKTVWRNGKENHIIEKVLLCEERLPEIYTYLKRLPRAEQKRVTWDILEDYRKRMTTPGALKFIEQMEQRIRDGKTVKEYIDLSRPEETKQLLLALSRVEENTEECFIREFSIRHFHDSKRFETLKGKVCRILREELQEYADLENEELLAEYQIYHTPGYVYLKGSVCVNMSGEHIDVSKFPNGIGFTLQTEERDESLTLFLGNEQISTVYTIENLTTFFRFQKPESLIVYLGGYHNRQRRLLLKKIHEAFSEAAFYHFGDIDAGGFYIYHHLVNKTGIPFAMYHMDEETLKQYEKYGKPLTDQDIKRLNVLKDKEKNTEICRTITYMLEHNVKLEQECIEVLA